MSSYDCFLILILLLSSKARTFSNLSCCIINFISFNCMFIIKTQFSTRNADCNKKESFSILKLRLDYFSSILFGLFVDHLVVHDWYHFGRFCVHRVSPVLFCAFRSFFNGSSFYLLLLLLFFYAYVPMYPILFALKSITVRFLGLSLGM